MTCKECRWWVDSAVTFGTSIIAKACFEGGKDLRLGTCHRHYDRPSATEDDWCGDFEPLTVEPQKPTTDHAK